MSTVPTPRIEQRHTDPSHRPLADEGSRSFEQTIVSRHVADVLDGRCKLDMKIVELAGGFHEFESQMDLAENIRRWQAMQARGSLWRRLCSRLFSKVSR